MPVYAIIDISTLHLRVLKLGIVTDIEVILKKEDGNGA